MGVAVLLARHPHSRPEHLDRSPASQVHCSAKEKRAEFWQAFKEFMARYRVSVERLRHGEPTTAFPANCFAPRRRFASVRAGAARQGAGHAVSGGIDPQPVLGLGGREGRRSRGAFGEAVRVVRTAAEDDLGAAALTQPSILAAMCRRWGIEPPSSNDVLGTFFFHRTFFFHLAPSSTSF
ncbi:MAG TPA: hypothetical protein VMT85_08545 [Thermoanaerobaculia bacterium]|nr:hypothetical protein [Thermoanaerobaculia bacterium]